MRNRIMTLMGVIATLAIVPPAWVRGEEAATSPAMVAFTPLEPAGPAYVPEVAEVASLVQQLHTADGRTREAAATRLAELPLAALPAVKQELAKQPRSPEADA